MQKSIDHKPRLLTVSQVAQQLGVSERFVRELIARHTLPSIKIGGARRIAVAALEQYLSKLMEEAR